jgi:hypothetical protein
VARRIVDSIAPSRLGFATSEEHTMNIRLIVAFLSLSSAGLFTTTLIFAGLWIRARERALRAGFQPPKQVDTSTTDIQYLVHAVDSIAIEVERISEGQRFTTQVLAERGAGSGPQKRGSIPERVITPH